MFELFAWDYESCDRSMENKKSPRATEFCSFITDWGPIFSIRVPPSLPAIPILPMKKYMLLLHCMAVYVTFIETIDEGEIDKVKQSSVSMVAELAGVLFPRGQFYFLLGYFVHGDDRHLL